MKFINTFINVVFIFLIFYSCESSTSNPEIVVLRDPEFTFQQDKSLLYFGVRVINEYESQQLNSVNVKWYGTDKENSPVIITLLDNGKNGDILKHDGLYSWQIPNTADSINYVIGQDLLGDTVNVKTNIIVYMDFIATHGLDSTVLSDSFTIGNIIPEIIEIFAPDTILRPQGDSLYLELISARVHDAENDINWVGFTSFWVDSSRMMNNGNYIYLYDDGSSIVLFQPDLTSGDITINDGIYSFNIPIYGSGTIDTNRQTKTGTFKWEFITQDEFGEYSKIKEHDVFIK